MPIRFFILYVEAVIFYNWNMFVGFPLYNV